MRVALAGTWVPLPSQGNEPANFNLALGYLEATLRERLDGVEVTRVDSPMPLGDESLAESVVDRILANDPEVVGVSSFCWDSDAFASLLPALKRRSPSCRVILGGPTATFDGPAFMQRSSAVDVVVRGEGEAALVELLQGGLDDPARVPGILWRDGDRLRESAPRPAIPDLDSIPSPYLSGVMRPPRNQFALECSRGCVFRCKHCAWKNFLGPLRFRAPARIADELRWAAGNDYGAAFILDASINFDTAWLDSLTAAVADAIPHDAIRFSYFLSHQHYEPAQLPLLARFAAHEIWLGVESFNPTALKSISRPPVDPLAFARLLDELSVLGPLHLSIMLGIPGDTLEGFRRTVDLLAELSEGGPRARIGSVRVFWTLVPPGSFFAERRDALGIRTPARGMPYVLHSRSFPEDDMKAAFAFLHQHRRRDLFVWDDPLPGRYYADLQGIELHRKRVHPTAFGDSRLALAHLHALLPWSAQPRPLGAGWQLKSTYAHEGWPTLAFENGNRRVLIQVRHRVDGGPCFTSTRHHALMWVQPSPNAAPDADLAKLMRFVAAEIGKRESAR